MATHSSTSGNPPDLTNPAEIAREAIKRLATQRVAPTPEAYARAYAEIAGLPAQAQHPSVSAMKQLVADFRETSQGRRVVQPLMLGLEQNNWDQVRAALLSLAQDDQSAQQNWPEILRDLLRLWEMRHEGLTQARKRESLDHVLNTFGSEPAKLYPKLRALTRAWSEERAREAGEALTEEDPRTAKNPSGIEVRDEARNGFPPDNGLKSLEPRSAVELARITPAFVASTDQEAPALRELLAQTMMVAVNQRLGYSEEMEQEAHALAERCRRVASLSEINQLSTQIRQFWVQLELRGETLDQMIKGLLTLLHLLVHNMSDLIDDDRWVKGQTERMQKILEQPLSPQVLEMASEGFREFIFRQGTLKTSLDEAKLAIRNMVQVFIDRLALMSESTGTYSERIDGYAEQLKTVNDLPQLSSLVEALMQDTRAIQADMIRSHEELLEARKQVQIHEDRIQDLQESLETLSEMISQDPLTSTLNRRGLEQLYEIEVSRCERRGKPLSIAILDIDNFKQLNDLLGHQAGDEALVHLSNIVRQVIRPTDAVARYGGEEFVIILPETDGVEAEQIIVRVQRELTKRFFLHNHEKVLITFSAGVATRHDGEVRESMIERADQAMYQAKHAGKNRVMRVS